MGDTVRRIAPVSAAYDLRHEQLRRRPVLEVGLLFLACAFITVLYRPIGTALAILGCCCAVGIWFHRAGVSARNRRVSVVYTALSIVLLGFAWHGSIWHVVSGSVRPSVLNTSIGRQQTVVTTAYCRTGLTAAGTWTHRGTAASELRFGTQLYVPGYGTATVLDRGGAIGPRRLDLYMASCAAAQQWGRRPVKISILGVQRIRRIYAGVNVR